MRALAFILGGLILAFGFPPMPTALPWVSVATPVATADAAVYVHEKDDSAIPSGVMAGLNRLNRERNVMATVFEDDTTTGDGDVPEQYKLPLEAARKHGMPCLVVMAGGKVLRVVKVATADEVWGAVP